MPESDSSPRARIMDWRRTERARLIEARLRVPVAERQEASTAIAARLDVYCHEQGLLQAGGIVSGYWPLRGEPDLRPWLARLHEEGMTCVLPVVVEKGAPLVFRRWSPGCEMEKGFWNIPVPAAREEFTPQVLLAPVVGFDARCYRLGYGGGYFDRTLALLEAGHCPHRTIGIGFDEAQLAAFEALPHDIRLHVIVTPTRVLA
jgi:5-formyltetrahydrofolate cyclo-ligase